MKLNFTANKRINQTIFESFLDFFIWSFLPKNIQLLLGKYRIRVEAKSTAHFNPQGIYRIDREFCTFRAFFWHYILILPYWLRKNAEAFALFLGIPKELAYEIGAIALDTTTDSGNQEGTDPWSWSHTSTGSNLVLVCDAGWWSNSGSIGTPTATYNSVSLTKQAESFDGSAAKYYATIWYLANPTTGANTATLDFSSASYGKAGVQTFSGCNTASPIDASGASQSASGTSSTISVTTNNANSFLVDCIAVPDSTGTDDPIIDGSQTTNWHGSTNRKLASSRKATTTAGSYGMSWTWTTNAIAGRAVIAINEAVAVTFIPQVIIF